MFLNREVAAKYHFGHPSYTLTLPLPLGGKSTRDLNFLTTFSTPNLIIPHLDLEFEATTINLPEVSIPVSMSLSVPTLERAEMSGKLNSNLYNLEAAVSAARDPATDLRYSSKVEFTGTSPIDLLSIKVEGKKKHALYAFDLNDCLLIHSFSFLAQDLPLLSPHLTILS